MMYEITYRDRDGAERIGDLQEYSQRDVSEMSTDEIMDLYQRAQDVADGKVVIDVFGFNESIVRLVRVGDDGSRTVMAG